MSPRLRRLTADAEQVAAMFHDHPRISVVETSGTPPERYRFEMRVRGLVPSRDGSTVADRHRVEVFLPTEYPRRPPFCRMLTPVFHPNIDPQKICIGDHWSAAQSLPDMVQRIAEMIAWQSYNTKSPLNARAAAWVEQHPERVPLEAGDLGAMG